MCVIMLNLIFISYKFKARGFDHRLVDLNGMCGVDPMKQLPITEAKPFSFQSDARLEHRKKMEDEKKDKEQTIKQQQQQEHGHEKVHAVKLYHFIENEME